MASNPPGGSRSGSFREPLPCRHFANHGWCRDGHLCRRSHTVFSVPHLGYMSSGNANAARTDQKMIKKKCYFYNHGGCKFGNSCRYLHTDEDEGKTISSKSGNSSSVTEVTNTVADLKLSGTNYTSKPAVETSARSRITGEVNEQDKENVNQGAKEEKNEQASSSNTKGEEKTTEEKDERECGVCFDKISEKTKLKARKYGILENCRHVFCLDCILKWRKEKDYSRKKNRTCPECRVESDFVLRSSKWIGDEASKKRHIKKVKGFLSNKPCKFFDQGKGNKICKDGKDCLYMHKFADGSLQDKSLLPSRDEQVGYHPDMDDEFDWDSSDAEDFFDYDFDGDSDIFDSDDDYYFYGHDPLDFLNDLFFH